jgi:pimeloyl-ACP methyl ester carboxylesterase
MKWIAKLLGWSLLALIVLAAGLYFTSDAPDLDPAYLTQKYGGPPSEFVTDPSGLKVHVRDQGIRTGEVLVLLHGSNSSLHTWEPWVARLKDQYRIITLDLPGHGLTGPHPRDDYSADSMLAVVDNVLALKGINRFSIGGNSMGGWLAWRYALNNQTRLDNLILVDAAGADAPGKSLPLGFRLAQSDTFGPMLKQRTPRWLIKLSLWQSMGVTDALTAEMVDRHWELLRYPGNRAATLIRMRQPRQNELLPQLRTVATPTLILWGAKDTLTPVGGAKVFSDLLANSEGFIHDEAGHLPQEEIPEKSAGDVRAFLIQSAKDRAPVQLPIPR